MHTPSSERRTSGKSIRQLATPFTPPEKNPDRKDWIPDHKKHICMVCQRERFTMVREAECISEMGCELAYVIGCDPAMISCSALY